MVNWALGSLKGAATLLVFVLVSIGLYSIWNFFAGDKLEEHRVTYIQSAEQVDKLFSGFAYVSLVGIEEQKHGPDSVLTDDWVWSERLSRSTQTRDAFLANPPKFAGVCGWFYRVGFGYESREHAVKAFAAMDGKGVLPTVLTIEAVDVFTDGPSKHIKRKCAEADQVLLNVEDSRHKKILARLRYDYLLDKQYSSGCRTVAAFATPQFAVTAAAASQAGASDASPLKACLEHASKTANKERNEMVAAIRSGGGSGTQVSRVDGETKPVKLVAYAGLRGILEPLSVYVDSKQALGPSRVSIDNPVGAIGTLAVTFSTVGSVSYTDKLLWVIPLEEKFSVRRDISVAYFGSTIKSIAVRKSSAGAVWSVRAEEPTFLATDRRTDVSLTSKGFYESKKVSLKSMNDNTVRAVEWAIKEIEPQAKRLAKANIRSALSVSAEHSKAAGLELVFE